MFVRLVLNVPSGPKKSMLIVCDPADVFPISISVDQPPPVTTCGKTSEFVAPVEVIVGTGEVVTVTGEVGGDGAGAGGKPRPNPGEEMLAGAVVAGSGGRPSPNPGDDVLGVVAVTG